MKQLTGDISEDQEEGNHSCQYSIHGRKVRKESRSTLNCWPYAGAVLIRSQSAEGQDEAGSAPL